MMGGKIITAVKNYRILHTEWSSGWGGQEQRIILECSKIQELGHFVVIACQPGSGILPRAQEAGIVTEIVRIRSGFDPKAVWDLVRLIKKHHINIVNTHSGKDSWPGGFAAKLASTDLLVRTRHLAIPLSTSPFNFIHRMADGIITTGESVREAMISRNRIQPDRIVSIPTGISLERFSPGLDPQSVRASLGIEPDCMVVSIIAILRGIKRHDVFLKAARLIKDRIGHVRFLIVGDGPMKDYISGVITELGLEKDVHMLGHREDVPELFAASDVIALTSDMEGVPQSISQAMAMEKPVVAAAVGGIPDLIIDQESGLFAEAGNPESFADKICTLLENKELRGALGIAARKFVLERHTDTIMANRTIDFYRHLLDLKISASFIS
jgi:glycosyltransferase involved in cell wall biosynthesis